MRRCLGYLILMMLLTACNHLLVPKIKISFEAAKYLNTDPDGKPSPLLVEVYELRAAYPFQQVSYQSLQNDPAATLGNSLLDKRSWVIRPDEIRTWQKTLSPDIKFIGITAGYRAQSKSKWKQLIRIDNKRSKTVKLTLASQGIISHEQ